MTTTTKAKPTTAWDDEVGVLLVEYAGADFQVDPTYNPKTQRHGYVIYEYWLNPDNTGGVETFHRHGAEYPTVDEALIAAVELIEDRIDYERGQRG